MHEWLKGVKERMSRPPTEMEKKRMRELRGEGYSLDIISKTVGFSRGTVHKYTKNIKIQVGRYQKTLLSALVAGTIIDLETTGLYPSRDDIITFGWLTGNEIQVIQRVEASPETFYGCIEEELDRIPSPLYAYNASFERDFLKSKTGRDLEFIDVFKPWRNMAERKGLKWPSLDKISPVPYRYMGEKPVKGGDVVVIWKSYLRNRKLGSLSLIVMHNMRDLIQTLSLLSYLESYEV